MTVNELLDQRRALKPKVKVLNVAVSHALEALNQDKAPNVITPALQKDIGLIKANVTAWEGVMAEIQEKREPKKA
ncbi:hypothetical protein CMUS01_15111 [Colletotrichum musicola]|uniref:Uncharacterized protein n=1 Tax=Colletotrichum musicola TaxID=2175873 RepID=A0A8H6MPH7_9PEZI|nr:hypothetical protein CMUS01_15111 [Colletotrichum musicola]